MAENQEKMIQHIENKLPTLLFEADEMGNDFVHVQSLYNDMQWLLNQLKSANDENKRLREALGKTRSDILSIGEIISIAVGCGETVDLSNLNEKLHEMFLRLDGEQHEPSAD